MWSDSTVAVWQIIFHLSVLWSFIHSYLKRGFFSYHLPLHVALIRFSAGLSELDVTLKCCSTQNGSHSLRKSYKFSYCHRQTSLQKRGKFLKPRSYSHCRSPEGLLLSPAPIINAWFQAQWVVIFSWAREWHTQTCVPEEFCCVLGCRWLM